MNAKVRKLYKRERTDRIRIRLFDVFIITSMELIYLGYLLWCWFILGG